jgi:hypothetical protein
MSPSASRAARIIGTIVAWPHDTQHRFPIAYPDLGDWGPIGCDCDRLEAIGNKLLDADFVEFIVATDAGSLILLPGPGRTGARKGSTSLRGPRGGPANGRGRLTPPSPLFSVDLDAVAPGSAPETARHVAPRTGRPRVSTRPPVRLRGARPVRDARSANSGASSRRPQGAGLRGLRSAPVENPSWFDFRREGPQRDLVATNGFSGPKAYRVTEDPGLSSLPAVK